MEAAPSLTSISFLSSILIRCDETSLELTAAGPEATARVRVTPDSEISIEQPGLTAAPVRQLHALLRALEEDRLVLSGDESGTEIETEGGAYRLASVGFESSSVMDPDMEGTTIVIDGAVLARMIAKVTFAAHQDDTQPVLSGVRLRYANGRLSLAATDRHRLALATAAAEVERGAQAQVVVPANALALVARYVRQGLRLTKIVIGKRRILWSFDSGDIVARLVEGTYVNVESVIPDGRAAEVETSRENLAATIRRSLVMSSRENHLVTLAFHPTEATADSSNPDIGATAHERVAVSLQGTEMEVAYNAMYLSEILDRIDSEQVRLRFSGPGSAVLIDAAEGGDRRQQEETFLCLLMPVRTSG